MENRIKELLAERGWTQRDLAVKTHVSEALLNRYIVGEHVPRYETMCRIAAALGKPVSAVFPPPKSEARS